MATKPKVVDRSGIARLERESRAIKRHLEKLFAPYSAYASPLEKLYADLAEELGESIVSGSEAVVDMRRKERERHATQRSST